ncbi:hypothetical protein [Piscirickettsia salmonis]|uniref:hypothetical protein n=1 Tax=Piscirickettsia salmonis TaxID=1238 RepID=UPI001E5535AB|nr:hypothetical protein [Piscirickettsia salmonis]QGP28949.1 hypothetical protein Psal160_01311 [Piscirickettsia salmonis]
MIIRQNAFTKTVVQNIQQLKQVLPGLNIDEREYKDLSQDRAALRCITTELFASDWPSAGCRVLSAALLSAYSRAA